MPQTVEKERLRKQLLEQRDGLSPDFINISSGKIRDNLRKIAQYRNAKTIGGYHAIGSEVRTREILQEILNSGRELCLPRVEKNDIVFRKISGFLDLEIGNFGVMEPKERCKILENLDVILVPAIALTRHGYRLGYGYGYYDRYLHKVQSKKIGLSYARQVVKSIPLDDHDVRVDFIVTEDKVIQT